MKLGCGLILFLILLLGVGVWIVAVGVSGYEAEIAYERDLCASGDHASCYAWYGYNRASRKPHICGLNPGVRRLQICASIEREYEAQKQENPALTKRELARDLCDERGDEASCIMWNAYNRALGNDVCGLNPGIRRLQICAGYEAQKQENPALTKREYDEARYEAQDNEFKRRNAELRRRWGLD